ncbi:hypothetical protein CHARACLAT_006561 [Characodon lateralis]|uniref:Uncharacterized protein n=1 Tax=Characodon lateralis TaxID=208331 RepID=A0ABU7EK55_9TELE|nr:hypothetical protein [Characodon lateralis]
MHTLIHTPKGNLERPINLTGMSLDCGRKPEYLVRTHSCTGITCEFEKCVVHLVRLSLPGLAARRSWVQLPAGGISAWSLHVLPMHAWVLTGYSDFLPQSKNMTVR